MTRLKVRELALKKGLNISSFQLLAKLPMTNTRRIWFSSATGLQRDEGSLKAVNLDTLVHIAHTLNVSVDELIDK